MTLTLFGAAALALSLPAQPGASAPAAGLFTLAEMQAMCRGESGGDAQFRTPSAYALLAELQRAKCRMYLLGLADGLGLAGTQAADPAGREALGSQLAEAVLRAPADDAAGVAGIVRAALAGPGSR